jgi:hypothetical protein
MSGRVKKSKSSKNQCGQIEWLGTKERPASSHLVLTRTCDCMSNVEGIMKAQNDFARVIFFAMVVVPLMPILTASLVYAQLSDTTPPTLVSFSFSPTSVDVTAGPQSVTFTLGVTDDLSGVASAYIKLMSPSGKQSLEETAYSFFANPLNVTLQTTISIPQFSESGVWKVESISLFDLVGNRATLSTTFLATMGFPTDLMVISIQDLTPPQLTSVSLTPSTIDVSNGPQTVTVNLGVKDALSGANFICNPSCPGLYVLSPSGHAQKGVVGLGLALISGTPQNGMWQGKLTLPQFSEAGAWSIFIGLADAAGNSSNLDSAALKAMGFTNTLNVKSVPSDGSPPNLAGFSFSPTFIDTSTGAQNVTLTFQLTDDLSGVDFLAIVFVSQSGGQIQILFGGLTNPFTLVAGTPLNGTWKGTLTFPKFSEAGTWSVSEVSLEDTALNSSLLDNDTLKTLGFSTNLVVTQSPFIPDGTITNPAIGGTVMDQIFGTRAQVTFPPGLLSQPTQVSIDVFDKPPSIPLPSGFQSDPGTRFVNLQFTPHPATPLPAPGLTLVLPTVNPMVPGTTLSLWRVDPVTGNLVPAQSVSGGSVVGAVNADGLSATFTGIASLSVVVGLIPKGIPGDVNGDGKVNCDDVAIVKASFGKRKRQTGFDPRADVNNDGVVDVRDLAFVSRQLPAGTRCP